MENLKNKLNEEIEVLNEIADNNDIENDYSEGIAYGIEFATKRIKEIVDNHKELNILQLQLELLLERHNEVLESDNISDTSKGLLTIIDNEIANIIE